MEDYLAQDGEKDPGLREHLQKVAAGISASGLGGAQYGLDSGGGSRSFTPRPPSDVISPGQTPHAGSATAPNMTPKPGEPRDYNPDTDYMIGMAHPLTKPLKDFSIEEQLYYGTVLAQKPGLQNEHAIMEFDQMYGKGASNRLSKMYGKEGNFEKGSEQVTDADRAWIKKTFGPTGMRAFEAIRKSSQGNSDDQNDDYLGALAEPFTNPVMGPLDKPLSQQDIDSQMFYGSYLAGRRMPGGNYNGKSVANQGVMDDFDKIYGKGSSQRLHNLMSQDGNPTSKDFDWLEKTFGKEGLHMFDLLRRESQDPTEEGESDQERAYIDSLSKEFRPKPNVPAF